MALGQNNHGGTVNASISVDAASGAFVYTFNDPYNMLVNLTNVSGIVVNGGNLNDQFDLQNSSGLLLNGGAGNDTFSVGASAGSLNGTIIRGGTGVNLVQLNGSNTAIDLTQGSSGIEFVVGRRGLTGESVTVNLNQLSSSTLTNGGTGRAFAAVIGASGNVNVIETGAFNLVGVVNAASQGFSPMGTPVTGAALTSLLASVTQISSVQGNLAADYAGTYDKSVPPGETYVPAALNAYVFSDGTKTYTVWSDGVVTPTSSKGVVQPTAYQPAPSTPAVAPTFNQVPIFNKNQTWADGTLHINPAGLTTLGLGDGSALAYAAIIVKGVTGTVVHGDTGANGGNWFGLGQSGGNNRIVGSSAGDIFDLVNSRSLQDVLVGGQGFDVVRAPVSGVDVNLTASNAATGTVSIGINGVVSNGGNVLTAQTVEVDVGKLKYSLDATGAKTAVFEAMLGSSIDTVTLSGVGTWVEIATFAPGAALPTHATALQGGAILDALYASKSHTAENSLTGYLFEQVSPSGAPLKYATIYTDATVSNALAVPAALAQAMAQLGSSPMSGLASGALSSAMSKPMALAAAHA